MNNKSTFFDRRTIIRRLKVCFYVTLIIIVIPDLFIEKHPHYGWENLFGSYAIFGFLSCVAIIIVSKVLGKLFLQKPEDYYDR